MCLFLNGFIQTPTATESAQPMEESSPVHPIPHAASTGLEENGVHGGMEVVNSLQSSCDCFMWNQTKNDTKQRNKVKEDKTHNN